MALNRLVGYWNTRDWPDDIREIHASWIAYGPKDIKIYDYCEAASFIKDVYGERELNAFKLCAIPAMQSDFFRTLEILELGGLYMDMGIELLRHPAEFLSPDNNIVLYRRWHGRIVNNLFSAEKGNLLLSKIKDVILSNIERRISNNIWEVTGPKVWNDLTNTGQNTAGIRVICHEDIAGKTHVFRQDLNHKDAGRHWKDVQQKHSIYADM